MIMAEFRPSGSQNELLPTRKPEYEPYRNPNIILPQIFKVSRNVIDLDKPEGRLVVYSQIDLPTNSQAKTPICLRDPIKDTASPDAPKHSVN